MKTKPGGIKPRLNLENTIFEVNEYIFTIDINNKNYNDFMNCKINIVYSRTNNVRIKEIINTFTFTEQGNLSVYKNKINCYFLAEN